MDDFGQISPFMRQQLEMKANGNVTAPKNIIKTVSAAYQQYFAVRQDNLGRIGVYAAVLGMLAGNPPYDQVELESNGLGHIANFNNYKARSTYEKEAQGYWNLINSTEVYIKIKLAGDEPGLQRIADTIARHYSDVTKEWVDFEVNFNLLGAQLTSLGLCPVMFPHEESPLWEVIDLSRFFIPSQTEVFMSKLSNVSVESIYTVQDLFQIYENIGKGSPWNKESLGKFLILKANALNQTTGNGFGTILNEVELQRFVDNDDTITNRYFTDTVRLVNMYQKEYDNKISHYIFSGDQFTTTNGGAKTPSTDDFLYFVDRQYDTIEDAIIIFTASPGERTVHGNQGSGQKMFAGAQAINMLDCNIVDQAKMASTILVSSLATGGRDVSAIRVYPGMFTDIGAMEFHQNNLGANINQSILASQYLSSGLETNSVNSGNDPAYPDRAQGSVGDSQARRQDFKEFGTLRNVVAHFYNTFDKVNRISFIRFLTLKEGAPGWELVKEFRRRCKEDGVPDVFFDTAKRGLNGLPIRYRSVKAVRVAGDGSTLARIMGLEALAPIIGTFNQKQLTAYKRDYVGATVGIDYVDTYASDEVGDEVSGGASLARTEDNLMKVGGEPLFSADNDQSAHADEHLGTLTGIVQAVAQQQMSPVDANKIMEMGIPHLTEHIQYMSRAPQFYRDTLNRIEKPYKQLLQWAQLNKRNAEAMIEAAMRKQQEDQAATEQVMTDAQRKDFVAHADVARADVKVAAQNERADKANETRAEILRDKAQSDADTKRLKVQLEADVKRQATAKGREQMELEASTPEALSNELAGLLGSTPSTVDFEA